MKKTYMTPEMKEYQIRFNNQLLAGSVEYDGTTDVSDTEFTGTSDDIF